MMNKYERKIKGSFDKLGGDEKDVVRHVLSCFHFLNGKPHDDGSMGSVNISPMQFNDCLAYMKKYHERP